MRRLDAESATWPAGLFSWATACCRSAQPPAAPIAPNRPRRLIELVDNIVGMAGSWRRFEREERQSKSPCAILRQSWLVRRAPSLTRRAATSRNGRLWQPEALAREHGRHRLRWDVLLPSCRRIAHSD